MTLRLPTSAARKAGVTRRSPVATRSIVVNVLICGSEGRGDEGGPRAAAVLLRDRLPSRVQVRLVGQLDIDDLLAVPAGAAVVVVDTATGIPRGHVVDLPLSGFIGRDDDLRPRSSQALGFPEVAGLAELIRGRPLGGRIVVIGGSRFGLGTGPSGAVAAAIPSLVETIIETVDRLAGADGPHRDPA